jgi:hypothetical protein
MIPGIIIGLILLCIVLLVLWMIEHYELKRYNRRVEEVRSDMLSVSIDNSLDTIKRASDDRRAVEAHNRNGVHRPVTGTPQYD